MREKILHKIIKIIPKKIKYFIFIDIWAKATTGKYSNTEAPKITCSEALNRFED